MTARRLLCVSGFTRPIVSFLFIAELRHKTADPTTRRPTAIGLATLVSKTNVEQAFIFTYIVVYLFGVNVLRYASWSLIRLVFCFFFPSSPWVYCRILFFIVVAIYRYRFCYHAAIAAAAMFVICLCSTAFQNRIAVDRGSRLYQAVMAVIALRYTHIYIYIWAVVVVVETLFHLSWKLTATNSSYWNSLIVCQILNRLQPSAAIGNQIRSLLRLVVLMKKKLWSSKDQKGKDGRLTIWRIAIRKSPSSSSKAEKQRSNAAGPAPTGAFHSALSSSDLLQPHHHHHLLQQQHPDGQRHIFQENTYKKITPCDVCSQVLRGITSLSSYKCDIELRYGIEVDFITFTLHTAIHLIYKKLVSYNWIECQSHSILTDKMLGVR